MASAASAAALARHNLIAAAAAAAAAPTQPSVQQSGADTPTSGRQQSNESSENGQPSTGSSSASLPRRPSPGVARRCGIKRRLPRPLARLLGDQSNSDEQRANNRAPEQQQHTAAAAAAAAELLLHQYRFLQQQQHAAQIGAPRVGAFLLPPPPHLFGLMHRLNDPLFRPPPPSYNMAMNEQRMQMIMQERIGLQQQLAAVGGAASASQQQQPTICSAPTSSTASAEQQQQQQRQSAEYAPPTIQPAAGQPFERDSGNSLITNNDIYMASTSGAYQVDAANSTEPQQMGATSQTPACGELAVNEGHSSRGPPQSPAVAAATAVINVCRPAAGDTPQLSRPKSSLEIYGRF